MAEQARVPLDTPRIERRAALTLVGIRERHAFAGFDFAAFPRQERQLREGLGSVPGRAGETVYHVFWDMFGDAEAFDYLAGVAVADGARTPDGFARVALPAQRYAIFRRAGNASSGDTIRAIWHDWLPTSGYAPAGPPPVPGNPRRRVRRRERNWRLRDLGAARGVVGQWRRRRAIGARGVTTRANGR